MSKIYVFGIGGTGSRVLRSLTMLLASGVDAGGSTIVPIIIDPDQQAANFTETNALLRNYLTVRRGLSFGNGIENKFFRTEIKQQVNDFRLPLSANVYNQSFGEYLQLSTQTNANKALMRVLFSEDNLNSTMEVGFKGNPNIGSVVLNQFQDSQEFQEFANGFQQDDRIFIISSIFGGTGASGFPLLLKTLRTDNNIANSEYINNAIMGAITVLPYFGVKPDDKSEIDSTTFIGKAKSALSYYDRTISRANTLDYFYYIADSVTENYANHEGGGEQKNPAHQVELWAALAIVDFAKNATNPHTPDTRTRHKEFGIASANTPITFNDLASYTKNLISKPLAQLALFDGFMKNRLDADLHKPQPWVKDHGLDDDFMNGEFARAVKNLLRNYRDWLDELEKNNRRFAPFEFSDPDPINIIRGGSVKYGLFGDKRFEAFTSELNNATKGVNNAYSKEQKMIEFFYKATKELVDNKIRFSI